jgi:uncharacterized protein YodC (DUF2158 family)
MENKEIELNTEQVELIDLISNIRKERCSHLNVYDFANWEHYFKKLERALTEKDVDSDFYTQIAITSDGKTNYYKRYLSATDIVDMTECVKKINSLSSDIGEHGESLKRLSILCNKGINITFNIITNKSEHPIENDSHIYKKVDVTGIDIPKLNDYDTWHYVGDRLPKDTFMCIVKMFNEFSDTWTTGTGIFDNEKWEATDSSGEGWSVRYWRRCPDFEAEGHYVGLKEDIAKIYAKNKAFNNPNETQIEELKQVNDESTMTFKNKEKQSYKTNKIMSSEIKTENKLIKSFIAVGDVIEVEHCGELTTYKVEKFEVIPNSLYGPTEFVIHVKFSYNNGVSSIECTSDNFKYVRHISHADNNDDIESETLNRTEDVVTRTLDFNLGDLVVLKSDATKVMTVSDVNSSYAVECMFWSNDQMVQMSFPVYTIEKI